MSDLARWKVHGPVRTLTTELAEWDQSQGSWNLPRSISSATFRVDGKISSADYRNTDGSVSHFNYVYDGQDRLTEIQFRKNDQQVHHTLYSYDETGRHLRTIEVNPDGSQRDLEACYYQGEGRKKVRFLHPEMTDVACTYSVEGSEIAYPANGATRMTTIYDQSDRPAEVHFHDASDQLIQRIFITRDEAGRLSTEEMRQRGQVPFPGLEEKLESSSPEDRARLRAALSKLMCPADAFSKTTYTYDEKGRLQERNTSLLSLGGHRTTFQYDEHDNPIETTTREDSREKGIDEHGELRIIERSFQKQHIRFQYQYDAWGNWTERIVLCRLGAKDDFQRANIERREITYWNA